MSQKPKLEQIGHCGRVFSEFEVCDDWGFDDLCQGCPFNDREEEGEEYE